MNPLLPMPRRRLLLAGAGLAAVQAIGAPAAASGADTLAAALQAGADLPGLRALVVARHGELVAERYYGGANDRSLLPINSATKSVCSMLVGLALHDGSLKSLDQTIAQLLPDAVAELPDSPAAALTLRQILSGRTGLAFDPMLFGQLAAAKALPNFVLSRPPLPAGPAGWSYNDALVALIAPVLQRAQRADLATLAQRQLFAPLGIEAFEWRRGADGQPLAPAGLALRTRDLLKLAQLMAAGGRWRGSQLLPAAWVAESLAPLGTATWRAAPVADIGYGLLWFTGRLHGQRVAWAWGYGGQFALLAPELGLAVATAATSPPPAALRAQTDAVMTLVGQVVQAVA
jgi:CubicO group peptidase (beta-lactamase class C family)